MITRKEIAHVYTPKPIPNMPRIEDHSAQRYVPKPIPNLPRLEGVGPSTTNAPSLEGYKEANTVYVEQAIPNMPRLEDHSGFLETILFDIAGFLDDLFYDAHDDIQDAANEIAYENYIDDVVEYNAQVNEYNYARAVNYNNAVVAANNTVVFLARKELVGTMREAYGTAGPKWG